MTKPKPRGCSTRSSDRASLSGILAAAGTGTRAGSDLPKQFLSIAGLPLLEWSLRFLRECECNLIVVAVPRELVDEARSIVGDRAAVVEGGETRQASVANALEKVDTDLVIVHDAARPLATPELARRVIAALEHADAAVPVAPITDALKVVDDGQAKTLHGPVHAAQTPQAFRTEVLRTAHAASRGLVARDDAELVERAGGRVAAVDGSRWNVKLTFPEDFDLAEALLRGRE